MSGFCGFIGNQEMQRSEIVHGMMEKITHRGPDSSGVYIEADVTVGFVGASQPLYNEDQSLALIFSGRIYNHRPLKEMLLEKGHTFSSQSDSEIVLHLYEEYGAGLLDHLRGMFAIIIYDIAKASFFVAKDLFGVKPFYYGWTKEKTFLFASEIKSILAYPDFTPVLNEEALAQYLTFQYSVLPETFFKGVFRMPPGHYMVFKNGEYEMQRYFTPRFKPTNMTLEMAVKAIDKVAKDSIEVHMDSSEEIGAFLSSGVDSSSVAARFGGKKVFTVGFERAQYDELSYSKEMAASLGLEHYTKTITAKEYWDILPKVQYHMDEPLADPAAVGLYFACELAASHVKIALSGEGVDEFFGGYNIYKEPLDLKILTSLPMPIRKFLGKLATAIPFAIKGRNFLIRGSKTVEERFIGNANVFSKAEREKLLKRDIGGSPQDITAPIYKEVANADDITKMQYLDINLWMVGDILLKADRMSMAHALEVRGPFLDKEVFKVASRLPTPLRVNRSGTKYAFRRWAAQYLPESSARRKKLGFPVPTRHWLREDEYYSLVKEHFTSEVASKFFNTDLLIRLLDEHKSQRSDNSRKIWTVLMFLLWHKEYFESKTDENLQ